MKYFILSIAVTLGLSVSAQHVTTWTSTGEGSYFVTSSNNDGYNTTIFITKTDEGNTQLVLADVGYVCGYDEQVIDRTGWFTVDGVRYTAPCKVFGNQFISANLSANPTLVAALKAGHRCRMTVGDACSDVIQSGTFNLTGFTRAYTYVY